MLDQRKLRRRLASRLSQVVRSPVIEEKELAAFDIVMSRRKFLKASQMAMVAGLVAAGRPPTTWASADPDLGVSAGEVGLTPEEQASVTVASQLSIGTETFEDSIYAEPVVAQDQPNLHGLVEQAMNRRRFQSDLESTDPDESRFLDVNQHFGRAELIQLEQVSDASGNQSWELVHYRHPWKPRDEGIDTDGLVRDVIMTAADGLTNPTRIITMTGSNTNRFRPGANPGDPDVNQIVYGVFVEDLDGDLSGGFLCLGMGQATFSAGQHFADGDYPVVWGVASLAEDLHLSNTRPLERVDRYTSSGILDASGVPDPVQVTEHTVLYYYSESDKQSSQVVIMSLVDDLLDDVSVMLSNMPFPGDDGSNGPHVDARLNYIDWQPNSPVSKRDSLRTLAFTRSETNSNGHIDSYKTWTPKNDPVDESTGPFPMPASSPYAPTFFYSTYDGEYLNHDHSAGSTQSGMLAVDFADIRDIHGLYPVQIDDSSTPTIHLSIAYFEGFGLALIGFEEVAGSPPTLRIDGVFPLSVPDDAGIGNVTHIGGGASKFGGLRYVVSDDEGNVFLLRQRRAQPTNVSPYAPPIYGQFDDQGNPIGVYDTDVEFPIPSSTAAASNLNTLQEWVDALDPHAPELTFSYLLNAALAFGTDDTNQSQAQWFGNVYQAAYALPRSASDSEHVVVKQYDDGSSADYAAFAMICDPVKKSWRQRIIATQAAPMPVGKQESGDHYEALVTPVNAYGNAVSLTSAENANLQIEVRGDSTVEVVDDTHNLYHDIDRYTSFMAAPNPNTGSLSLAVKAETFSQVLYVRLVDTSGLETSVGDCAMLSSSGVVTYPWQSVNISAEAQQRMGNGAAPSAVLGDDAPIADDTVYISGGSLETSATAPDMPWDFKGGYDPSMSNMNDLATYLNTSGQNLVSVTGQLSLGASEDGTTIDPLTAGTAYPTDETRPTVSTAFGYAAGSVRTDIGAPTLPTGGVGGVWGSVSHALHDALHWLQHVEGKIYSELAGDGVSIVTDAESITVTISKDIMKQMNGVEEELEQVVDTVEEYADVVVNVIVTVVESSFIYQMVELLIALISLFFHLQDIIDLKDSLHQRFNDILTNGNGFKLPNVPSTYSSWTDVSSFLGAGNQISSALGGIDSSSVETTIVTTIGDEVALNPFTRKIIDKVLNKVSRYLAGELQDLPVSFDQDEAPIDFLLSEIDAIEQNVIDGTVDLTEDVAVQLVETLVSAIVNPQQAFRDLSTLLGPVSDELVSDVLEPIFEFVDSLIEGDASFVYDVVNYDEYVTLDIKPLADIAQLFGIGNASGDKVKLSGPDAIFFPVAVIIWVAVYEQHGKSINSVDDLSVGTFTPEGLGSSTVTDWNYARLTVDLVLQEAIGWIWTINSADKSPLLSSMIAWLNLARWINELIYLSLTWNSTDHLLDAAYGLLRPFTACADAVLTARSSFNPGDGWPFDPSRTDIMQAINALATIAIIGFDSTKVGESSPNESEILSLVGHDVARTQGVAMFLYNVLQAKDALEYFGAWATISPIGFSIMIDGALKTSASNPLPGVDDHPRRRGPRQDFEIPPRGGRRGRNKR
jgi:hypothetical protein